jgi:hypothetical protein
MARTKITTVRTTKRGGLTINFSEADGKALAKQINEGKDPFTASAKREFGHKLAEKIRKSPKID